MLGLGFGAVAQCYQEDGALAFGVWGEESGYVVVEKREAGGTEMLSIRSQIELPSENACFKLHRAISAIAKALQDRPQIGQEEHVHRSVGRQRLLQAQVAGLRPKVSPLQTFKQFLVAMKDVRSGIQTVNLVNDQIQMIELRSLRVEEIGRNAARCPAGGVRLSGDRRMPVVVDDRPERAAA